MHGLQARAVAAVGIARLYLKDHARRRRQYKNAVGHLERVIDAMGDEQTGLHKQATGKLANHGAQAPTCAYLAVPKARLERRRGSVPRFANFESLVSDPTACEPAPSGHPIVAEAIAPIEVEPAIAMLKKRSSGTRASDAGCGRSKRRVHSAPVACAYVAMHKSDLRAVGDESDSPAPAYESDSPTSILWSQASPRGCAATLACWFANLLDPRFEPIRAWRAPVRGGSSPDQHSGCEHWVQPLLQRSARKRAYNSVDLLPVADHDQQRDRLRAKPRGECWIRVDVDLHYLQVSRVTLGQVLEHGRDHPTRPAPRRPEIDHYGHGRGRLGRERGAVRVDDPRQSGLAPRAARDSAVDRDDAIASVATRAADDRHDHQVRARRSSGRLDPPSSALTGVWTHPRRNAKNMGQPVDRDHEHVILDALDATRTNETQDSERAAACPSSPPP